MANAIVALIVVGLMLMGTGMIAQSSLSSWDELSESWKELEARTGEISRTEIDVAAATIATSTSLSVTVENTGQTSLQNFNKWDVFIQYYGVTGTLHQQRLAYTTSTPAASQWTVSGIYMDALSRTAEIYQPDILDPAEQLVLSGILSASASSTATHRVVVTTANGISASRTFP